MALTRALAAFNPTALLPPVLPSAAGEGSADGCTITVLVKIGGTNDVEVEVDSRLEEEGTEMMTVEEVVVEFSGGVD